MNSGRSYLITAVTGDKSPLSPYMFRRAWIVIRKPKEMWAPSGFEFTSIRFEIIIFDIRVSIPMIMQNINSTYTYVFFRTWFDLSLILVSKAYFYSLNSTIKSCHSKHFLQALLQGVPSICWQLRTKFWKLKNHICQKVSLFWNPWKKRF